MEDQIIERAPPPNNKEKDEQISMFREKFETVVNVWKVSDGTGTETGKCLAFQIPVYIT
jgi:hypothetical protein